VTDSEQLEATRDKIRANGYKPTARESGVPETTIRRFVKGRDSLYRSTVALIKWAFPVAELAKVSEPVDKQECTCASEDGDGCFVHGCEICGKMNCSSDHA